MAKTYRTISLTASVALAVLVTVYCFEGSNGLLGNAAYRFFSGFLGSFRFMVPVLIILFALYKYISEKVGELADKSEKSKAEAIDKVFEKYGIDARVKKRIEGVTLDRYRIKVGQARVKSVLSLADEMQLKLRSGLVTITKENGKIFVDVPKKYVEAITLDHVFDDDEFLSSGKLSVPIGLTVSNQVRYGNIAEFPHCLIAGTTGSGKSVFLNVLICSLLRKNRPEDLRFVMIDPKRAELTRYNGIPHLIGDVVTDGHDAAGVLNFLVSEMNRRYRLLELNGFTNIEAYKKKSGAKLPYIVVIIDEFANLMLDKGFNAETPLKQLASMARACGIHLVASMHRPDRKVIEGAVKLNFPTRIALKVDSGISSRMILDELGAEKLRGKGDMKFLSSGAAESERLQGFNIGDSEVQALIKGLIKRYPRSAAQRYNRSEHIVGSEAGGGAPSTDNTQTARHTPQAVDEPIMNINQSDYNTSVNNFKEQNQKSKKLFSDDKTEGIIELAIQERKFGPSWIRTKLKCNNIKSTAIFSEVEKLQEDFGIKMIGDRKAGNQPYEFLLTESQFEEIKKQLRMS